MPTPRKRSSDGRKPGKGGPRKVEETRVVRPKGTKVVPRASPVLLPAKGEASDHDRRDAMLLYVMDIEKRPLSWLHKEHFPHLFESTLKSWWHREGWEEKRKKFWSNVDEALFRDFAKRITRQRMAELENLEDFAGKLTKSFSKGEMVKVTLDGKEVELPVIPKTFSTRDNAVRLMIALDERVDAKRNALLQDLPQIGASSVVGPAAGNVHISVEEARAMAHARLRVQQAQLTQGGDASAEAGDQEPEEQGPGKEPAMGGSK